MSRFDDEVVERLASNRENAKLNELARDFTYESTEPKYSYNFSWLGRPIIQYPQDVVAMQELLWTVKPDLVVETGIAHGGSLIFYASVLELLAACGGSPGGMVLGVDIDIRAHNREAIEAHPMARRITMIEGSSVDNSVVDMVRNVVAEHKNVLVCLDSSHTGDHVYRELELYAPMTTVGSYCVVFDTIVEHFPAETYPNRPWGPGNSPGSAVEQYLTEHPEFAPDRNIDAKLLISVAPGGYLKRVG